ncbi:hypothetical protein JMJ77_0007172 [Colletotrichum scovillei]|uniref:MACPF domain-containing protein n=1 Tax=Colletotrichum scovillei TaxID=1209932 RepID=A0A9P7RC88_9PEZI|nr:hypothetical protein JMJ77_0007172 [Colletotrichum scovillei]KAG7074138.1 hypothetical protein JMJ76_0010625 [Colletotrichum scovillei]KAG7081478.1 hypothetical protein JMJ78_0003598 [Colletotrichum scovillei]
MESAYNSPPSTPGAKTFNGATKSPSDSDTILTFQRIDKATPTSSSGAKADATSFPVTGSPGGTIGFAVLLKKCGFNANANVGMHGVTMAKIKEGMIAIGLAKEFDIWSSPSAILLDYDLTLSEYVEQVSKLTKTPESDVRIYYGLKKDHNAQTVQDIYKTGEFIIRIVQIKNDKSQAIQALRVMKSPPEDARADGHIIDSQELGSQTLSDLRDGISAMSQLKDKHHFCLPDETPLHDKTRFDDYIKMLDETCPYESSVPSINLRFKDASSCFDEDQPKTVLTALGDNKTVQKAETSSPSISPSSLDELQWELVMKNCQVMHGWYIDPVSTEIKMAPKPAFRLKSGLNLDYSPDSTVSTAEVEIAIPNYGVTDGSKIDVVTTESGIKHSLVRNSFDKSSMDNKIALGYSGIGINVASGKSFDSQGEQSSGSNRSVKSMIGIYKLPRVTLFLNADELVPTKAFIDGIEKIKKLGEEADETDVRKFYEKFGQFFCHEVVLGGMLLSTKALVGNESQEEEKSRCSFKHAIGMSVSSPVEVIIGADSKKEIASGADQSIVRSYKDSDDSVVFEAVGGNTILASSPQQWCATVGDYNNWRVIGRQEMKLILDSFQDSGDHELQDVVELFTKASQLTVSKFIDIPKSAKIIAQFRFKTKSTNADKTHYLRHDINNLIEFGTRSASEQRVMPQKYQGPRVEPYDPSWKDQDGLWTIAPVVGAGICCHGSQGRSQLVDGSRVTIRSGRDSQTAWYLSVLRTSAGIFVPCITTSKHFVWRVREVLRPNTRSTIAKEPSPDKPLRHDAVLCLTYDFEDNPRGYRDFKDDDRGFRNVEYPDKDTTQLVLVESRNRTDIWPDRRVLLLADGEPFFTESTAKVADLNDSEISVRIAKFNIDVRDQMDDDYDILQRDGNAIRARHEEQQKKLKTRDEGSSG